MIQEINREELAWAAGLYDGEGHTRQPGKRRNATIAVTVSQSSSPELLERFQRAVGLGSVLGPYEYRHRRPNQKPFFVFSASGFEATQHCLCCLWPWLGSTKRRQAVNSLLAWRAQPRKWFKSNGNRSVCRRGHRVEGDNAYVARSGYTVCRECRRQWDRQRYSATKK